MRVKTILELSHDEMVYLDSILDTFMGKEDPMLDDYKDERDEFASKLSSKLHFE